MIRAFATGLLLVFGLISVAFASPEYPPCSISQLTVMLEFGVDYADLEDRLAVDETLEDFLALRETQLHLRDRTWELLPRCAEAIAYGDLVTRRYDMFAALSANHFWWTALERAHPDTIFNPYREPFLDESYAELYHQLHADIEAKLANESSRNIADGILPSCTGPELEILYRVKNEYFLLLESFSSIRAQRGIPEYGTAHVKWSDALRARLPACDMAFEASILLRQNSFDVAVLFMLLGAGVEEERIPRHADSPVLEEIQALMAAVEAEYWAHRSSWLVDSTLASCTSKERDRLHHILASYLELLNYARGFGDGANLIEFGRAMIAWRTESWIQLPSCSEALEVGAVVRQSAGDTVEFDSDELAWLPAGAINSLSTTLTGETRLSQRLVEIDAGRFGSEYSWHEHLSGEDSRPTCATNDIDDIKNMVRGFLDVLEIGRSRNNWTGGLLAYIDTRITWRMDSKASVPDCRIRYDLSNMLSQDALHLVTGGLPVLGQLLSLGERTQTSMAAPEEEEADAGRTRRPYSNNLRSCNADELRRFSDHIEAYVNVIRDVALVETIDDLFDQMKRNLDWRQAQWVDLLACAETFEIGVLINQIASDMTTLNALDIAGIAPILNPYYRNRQRDIQALTLRVQEIAGKIAERDDAPQPTESSVLPFCTEAELATTRALLSDFRKGPRELLAGFTPDAVLQFSQFQDEWRPRVWSQVPACFEAVEVGLLMTRQSGDVMIISALDHVGANPEDDPFMDPRYCDFEALGTWLILLGADASTQVDVSSCVGLEVPRIPQ